MRRLIVAGIAATALVGLAPLASAATTGPDSAACAEAQVGVRVAAVDAYKEAEKLAAANAVIDNALKVQLASAKKDLEDAIAAYQALPPGTSASVRAAKLQAVTVAQAKLQLVLKIIEDKVPANDAALTRARAVLDKAVAERNKACESPVTTTVAPPPPASTTTAAPVTTTVVETPQVTVVPNDAPETGDGSTEV